MLIRLQVLIAMRALIGIEALMNKNTFEWEGTYSSVRGAFWNWRTLNLIITVNTVHGYGFESTSGIDSLLDVLLPNC